MISFFKLSLKLQGFPIEKAIHDLRVIANFSSAEHQQFTASRKEEIVNFHLQNNLFYKSLVGDLWDGSWETLPVLKKPDLQKPLSERLSNGFSEKNVYVNKTSGSSGTPFIFAKDKYAHALTWASNFYRFGWHGIDLDKAKQARFYGIPLDFIGYYKERLKDFLGNRYRFKVFDLSDYIFAGFIEKFKTEKFTYINGYTSSLVMFAKYLKEKNLILKTICPTLEVCMVTSEMLFKDDKLLLETYFGILIINEYGASELDLIAFENTNGEWQINAETLFVEILDENNKAVEHGKSGRVVITSLFNAAHPFIRYDIGDIGILDEKSTLQKPILKQLIGRTNDFAVLPSGKKTPGLTFYYLTKSIIEDDGNVKEFVICQTKINCFVVDYVSEKELNILQIKNIEKAIATYLEPDLDFVFNRRVCLERTNRGKLKQFTSEIS